mgnify:CR=1 FL=1
MVRQSGLGFGMGLALAATCLVFAIAGAGEKATRLALEIMARAAACMRVAAERGWLDCYYDAATPMRARLGLALPAQAARPVLTPAPVMPPTMAPQLASAAPPPRPVPSGPPPMPRNTGLFNGMFNDTKPIVRNAAVKSYEIARNGAFTMTLADGQVWQQIEEDQIYHPARWRRPAEEMQVTISPNAMHTFKLEMTGESKFYKVHRIR